MKLKNIFLVSLIFVLYFSASLYADKNKPYVPGEIIVKFKNKANVFSASSLSNQSINELLPELSQCGVLSQEKLFNRNSSQISAQSTPSQITGVVKISVAKDSDLESLVVGLNVNSNVEYAQVNHYIKLCAVLNDTYIKTSNTWGNSYKDLWNIYKIQADKAWTLGQDKNGVFVAVIDSGVDYNHAELQGRVTNWQDYSNQDFDSMDGDGHGTCLAGIITAKSNNSTGIAGIAQKAKILAMKIYPYGTEADCADAIKDAADQGVKVINMSWRVDGSNTSEVLAEAIDYAASKGVVLVAAAGNDNDYVANVFPANHPKVIAVGASDQYDQRCPFSNKGLYLDVVAPGGGSTTDLASAYNILSLKSSTYSDDYNNFVVRNNYLRLAGTSIAAAHVSGLAALILSKNPSLTPEAVSQIIKGTADKVGAQSDFGAGRINAYKALLATPSYEGQTIVTPSPQPAKPTKITPPDWVENLKIGDVAFDNKNHAYIVYTNQHKIVKYNVDANGKINTTKALATISDYKGSSLYYPMGVAVSSSGDRVYVADTYHNRVLIYNEHLQPWDEIQKKRVFLREYRYTEHEEYLGGLIKGGRSEYISDHPVYLNESLSLPFSVAFGSDYDLFIADSDHYRILKFDSSGLKKVSFYDPITRYFLLPDDKAVPQLFERIVYEKELGTSGIPLFYSVVSGQQRFYTNSIDAASPPLGDDNHEIVCKDINKNLFASPESIVIDKNGFIYVADTGNNRIQKFWPDGSFAIKFGSDILKSPKGVAVDSFGNIWVADTGNKRIIRFDPSGKFVKSYKPDTYEISPQKITIRGDKIYIVDASTNGLLMWNANGELSNVKTSANWLSPNKDGVKDSINISYNISQTAEISVLLLDENSKEVGALSATDKTLLDKSVKKAGSHKIIWDGIIRKTKLAQGTTQEEQGIIVDGSYKLKIIASFGDYTKSQTVNIKVDSAKPSLKLDRAPPHISPNGDKVQESLTIECSVVDKLSTNTQINLSLFKQNKSLQSLINRNEKLGANNKKTLQADWFGQLNGVVSEGAYVLKLKATDLAGNTASITKEVVVDITSPILTVSTPEVSFDQGKIKQIVIPYMVSEPGEIELELSSKDDGVLYQYKNLKQSSDNKKQYQFVWDGKNKKKQQAKIQSQYLYKITAKDLAGNTTTYSKYLIIDNQAPQIKNLTILPAIFSPKLGQTSKASFEVTDNLSTTLSNLIINVRDKDGNFIASLNESKTVPVGLINASWDGKNSKGEMIADDKYQLIISLDDAVDNNSRYNGNITIDTTPPTISSVLDNLACSPNGDGKLDQVEARLRSSEKGQIVLALGDVLKKQVSVEAHEEIRLAWLGDRFKLYRRDQASGKWEIASTYSAEQKVADGAHNLKIFTYDQAGNVSENKIYKIILDTTPPEIKTSASRTIFSPDGNGLYDQATFEAKINESGFLAYKLKDPAGKQIYNDQIAVSAEVACNFIWDQDGFLISDRKNFTTFIPYSSNLTDGKYYLEVTGLDRVANQSLSQTLEVKVDLTAPKLVSLSASPESFSPNNDGILDQAEISFNLTDESSSKIKVTAFFTNMKDRKVSTISRDRELPVGKQKLAWRARNEKGTLPDGKYRFKLLASDAAGNIYDSGYFSQELWLTVDTIPPSLEVNQNLYVFSPNNDGKYDTVDFSFNINEKSYLSLAIANQPLVNTLMNIGKSVSSWDGKENGQKVADGIYSYTASATDLAGNKTKNIFGKIKIDTTAPKIVALSALPNPFTPNGDSNKDTSTFYYKLSEPAFATTKIIDGNKKLFRRYEKATTGFVYPNLSKALENSTLSYGSWLWDGRGSHNELLGGDYGYQIVAEDNAGNIVKSGLKTVTVDHSPTLLPYAFARPDPFSPVNPNNSYTEIKYYLSRDNLKTTVEILGENNQAIKTLMVNELQNKGEHSVKWSGDFSSGFKGPRAVKDQTKVGDSSYEFRVYVYDSEGGPPASVTNTVLVDNTPPYIITTPLRLDYLKKQASFDYTVPEKARVIAKVYDQNHNLISTLLSGEARMPDKYTLAYDFSGRPVQDKNYFVIIAEDQAKNVAKKITQTFALDPSTLKFNSYQVNPGIFTPNGDGHTDLTAISYNFSGGVGPYKVSLEMQTLSGSTVKYLLEDELQTAGAHTYYWYGFAQNGDQVADGSYKYVITLEDKTGAKVIAEGQLQVVNTLPSLTLSTDLTSFSPNGDGAGDSLKIFYSIDYPVQYITGESLVKLEVINATGEAVWSKILNHTAGNYSYKYDGSTAAGGKIVAGDYSLKISGQDGLGSLAPPQTTKFTVVYDAPAIKMLFLQPNPFSPQVNNRNDQVVFSYSLSKKAYVSIGVRRQRIGSGEVRSLIANKLTDPYTIQAFSAPTITWDGKDNNGNFVSDGSYTIYIVATDEAGNDGQTSAMVEVDNTKPKPPVFNNLIATTSQSVVVLNATTEANVVVETLFNSVNRKTTANNLGVFSQTFNLMLGKNTFKARVIDLAGNESVYTQDYNIIYKRPTLGSTSETTAKPSQESSVQPNIQPSVEVTTQPTVETNITATEETTASSEASIDTEPPKIAINFPGADNWLTQESYVVGITVSDADLKNYWLLDWNSKVIASGESNISSSEVATIITSSLEGANYTLTLIAEDRQGFKTMTSETYKVDTVAPQLIDYLTEIKPQYASRETEVFVDFALAEAYLLGEPTVEVAGKVVAQYQPKRAYSKNRIDYYYSYTIGSSEQDGPKTISIEAIDLAGNLLHATFDKALFVDKTKPGVLVTSINPTPASLGQVKINFESSEKLKTIPKVVITQAGSSAAGLQALVADMGFNKYQATYDLVNKVAIYDGTAEVKIMVQDIALNENSTQASFVVDTIKPVFSNLSCLTNYNRNGAYYAKDQALVDVYFETSEELKYNPEVTINNDSATYQSLAGNQYHYQYTVDQAKILSQDNNRVATINISGYDFALNQGTKRSSSTSESFIVDISTPTVEVVKTASDESLIANPAHFGTNVDPNGTIPSATYLYYKLTEDSKVTLSVHKISNSLTSYKKEDFTESNKVTTLVNGLWQQGGQSLSVKWNGSIGNSQYAEPGKYAFIVTAQDAANNVTEIKYGGTFWIQDNVLRLRAPDQFEFQQAGITIESNPDSKIISPYGNSATGSKQKSARLYFRIDLGLTPKNLTVPEWIVAMGVEDIDWSKYKDTLKKVGAYQLKVYDASNTLVWYSPTREAYSGRILWADWSGIRTDGQYKMMVEVRDFLGKGIYQDQLGTKEVTVDNTSPTITAKSALPYYFSPSLTTATLTYEVADNLDQAKVQIDVYWDKNNNGSIEATDQYVASLLNDNSFRVANSSGSQYSQSWQPSNIGTAAKKGFDDGQYLFKLRAIDQAGNSSVISLKDLVVDTVKPSGSVVINSGTTYSSSAAVSLSLNASDANSGITMCFSNDGSSFTGYQSFSTTKAWSLASSDGTKKVYVKYKDRAGNWESFFDTIILDQAAPAKPVNLTAAPNSWTKANSFSISWDNPSDTSGIAGAYYQLGSSSLKYTTSNPFTVLATKQGGQTVKVWLKDKAGNALSSNNSLATLYYDSSVPNKPSVSVNHTLENTWDDHNSPYLTWTNPGDSGGSGINYYETRTNNGSWSPQTSPWHKTLSDGIHTIYVRAIDQAGNVGASDQASFRIDTVKPSVVAVPSSQKWTTGNVAVKLTVSDDRSGLETAQYAWSTSTSTPTSGWTSFTNGQSVIQSSNGTWYLHVKVVDKAGNTRSTYFGSYRKDGLKPTISFSGQADNTWYCSNNAINISISDSGGSNYRGYKLSWTGWPSTSPSGCEITSKITTYHPSHGSRTLYLRAWDQAGNMTSVAKIFKRDSTNPTITFGGQTPGVWYSSNNKITLSFADSESGYKCYKLNWGSAPSTSQSGAATSSLVTTYHPGQGGQTLYVRAWDNVGNMSLSSKTYYRDYTRPTVNFGGQAPATWYSGNNPITINLSDSGGSGYRGYKLSWGSWPSTDPNGCLTANSVTTYLPGEGKKTLYIRVWDGMGNRTDEARTYWRDNTAPVVSNVFLSRKIVIPDGINKDVKISFEVSGTDSSKVEVRDDGNNIVRTIGAGVVYAFGSNNITWNAKSDSGILVSPGYYHFRVVAQDLANNIATYESENFRVKSRDEVIFVDDNSGSMQDIRTLKVKADLSGYVQSYWKTNIDWFNNPALGDFNGDGQFLLAALMMQGDDQILIINPRTKKIIKSFDVPDTETPLAAGDFDGDGKDEVAFLTNSWIQIYNPLTGKQTKAWKISGRELAAGDFDGDGKDEIVTLDSEYYQNDIRIYLYKPATIVNGDSSNKYYKTWSVTKKTLFNVSNSIYYKSTVACGDVDDNGNDEIALTSSQYGEIYFGATTKQWSNMVYLFEPSGNKIKEFKVNDVGISHPYIGLGDFAGDGRAEIITISDVYGDTWMKIWNPYTTTIIKEDWVSDRCWRPSVEDVDCNYNVALSLSVGGLQARTQSASLEAPILISPDDLAEVRSLRPTFKWDHRVGATQNYTINLAKNEALTINHQSFIKSANTGSVDDKDSSLYHFNYSIHEFDPGLDRDTYYWQVTAQTTNEVATSEVRSFTVAPNLTLTAVTNYPNPFDPTCEQTKVRYRLGADVDEVTIRIYDLTGSLVKEIDNCPAMGEGSSVWDKYNDVSWDGRNGRGDLVRNGIYPFEVVATLGDQTVAARGKIAVLK